MGSLGSSKGPPGGATWQSTSSLGSPGKLRARPKPGSIKFRFPEQNCWFFFSKYCSEIFFFKVRIKESSNSCIFKRVKEGVYGVQITFCKIYSKIRGL